MTMNIACSLTTHFSKSLNMVAYTLQIANESAQSSVPWWQIVTGVLAIPASILGLIYTYRLSQKTRLESRKLQLEIYEKEGSLKQGQTDLPKIEEMALSSAAISVRLQDFVIRFLILYLTYTSWSLIEGLLNPFVDATVTYVTSEYLIYSPVWVRVFWISLIRNVFVVFRLMIFIFLGWPLFLDITRAVGLGPLSFLQRRRNSRGSKESS